MADGKEKPARVEARPLAGRTVVLTRPRSQSAQMASLLEERGARVLEVPCIAIAPPDDSYAALDRALLALPGRFDWLVVSSANGVDSLLARLAHLGLDARALAGPKIAAVGPATARALEAARIKPDLVPEEFSAEGLCRALSTEGVARRRFLVVRAQEGREILPERLAAEGAEVEVCAAYRTVRAAIDVEPLRARLLGGEISAVTFASPSAVKSFVASFGPGEARRLLETVCVAAIGPVTAKAAQELGLRVDVSPAEFTGVAMADELARRLGGWSGQ